LNIAGIFAIMPGQLNIPRPALPDWQVEVGSSMVYLYVLKSKHSPKTYTGITADMSRRLLEHNSGYSEFSSRYKPWEVVYTEELLSMKEARVREKYFKSAVGRRKLKQIIPR
jgi:putative endonuclease